MSRRIVTRDGTGLYVRESGPEAAPVTVLLAHGWTLDERCWAPVADTIAAGVQSGPPTRVVRYDHRGHGRSDDTPDERKTLERLADDMAEVIEQVIPAGPVVIAGHSMGGMTAMSLAQRHPELVAERVAGVALVATASGGLGGAATLGMSGRPAELFLAGKEKVTVSPLWTDRRALSSHPALLRAGVRPLLLGRQPDREAVRLTCDAIAGCRPTTISGFTPTLTAHERDAALAAFAELPVEVLVGSRDRLTPPRYSRRIRDGLPRSGLTVFPDAGHMLPVERVAGVAARIGALVRGTVRADRAA
ncbi:MULTISPECIES: alpha/beta fold hydrolase [Pseudonocardia]|uniref:Arylesterase n=2 Tax=Pseudonocardia TaxID=1847 RepID=A0A1Y2N5V3_PSEAH|nr:MULTISPECIES: alpha/beta hydrolase [Pseudonocardia]OSY42477.1 Arylesterase [Pseudonocardia autotrophica]TDN75996.1 pimeloyl-ACP methyl ester carboxylesterase [Pseudonocardia autotrophica]BBF99971.1 alpha/beta hydrolase [Pseudonocardia autotrophica]GEC25031.1 alpha/beta hydrolase [Pseudonocardia saturnea]